MNPTPPLTSFRSANGFVFLSGCLPKDPLTGTMSKGTIEEQTKIVLDQVEKLLIEAGSSLSDVIRVGAYLAHLDRDFAGFNDIYRNFFAAPFPARTTVGVTLRGALVEVDVVAVVKAT